MTKPFLQDLNHHAYYLIGNKALHDELLSVLEDEMSISYVGNPDFVDRSYDILLIDDARWVKDQSLVKSTVAGKKKIIVLTMNGINFEAQNTLLKILEEPPQDVHFFIIIPSAHLLLPTVKSRLLLLHLGDDLKTDDVDDATFIEAKKFLKSGVKDRLEYIKNLHEDLSKEKKNKQYAVDFLNNLEKIVYESLGAKKGRKMLETIGIARKYMNDRSPSIKMLLENIALVK